MSHWEGQDDLNRMWEDLGRMTEDLKRNFGTERDMSYMEDPMDIYRQHRSDRLKRGGASPEMWHTETYTSKTWGGEVTMKNEVPTSSALDQVKRADRLYRAISRKTAQGMYSTDPYTKKLCRDHAEAVHFANDSCDERPNSDNPEWLIHYRRAFIRAQKVPLTIPVNNLKSGVEALRQQMDSVSETMESYGWPSTPTSKPAEPAKPAKPLSPREKYEREDERLRSQRDRTRTDLELAVNEMDRAERNQKFFSLGSGIFMTAFGIMAFSVSGLVLTIILAGVAVLFGIMTLGSVGAKDKSAEQKLITARNQARSAAERYSDFVLNNHPDTYKIEGIDGQG